MSKAENDLANEAIEYLSVKGCFVWRNNTGAYQAGKRFIRYGFPGSPDVIGFSSGGRFIGIECKSKSGALSELQKTFQAECKKRNTLYITIKTIDDLLEIF